MSAHLFQVQVVVPERTSQVYHIVAHDGEDAIAAVRAEVPSCRVWTMEHVRAIDAITPAAVKAAAITMETPGT